DPSEGMALAFFEPREAPGRAGAATASRRAVKPARGLPITSLYARRARPGPVRCSPSNHPDCNVIMASQTKNKRKVVKSDAAAKGAAAEAGAEREHGPNGQVVDIPEHIELDVTFRSYPAARYTHDELGISDEQVLAMYRNMLLQRRFEER